MQRPSIEFDATGTHWQIELIDTASDISKITASILDYVGKFESDYSRFLDDSLIGRLNRDKSIDNPPQEFIDMLAYARDIHLATRGVFNISVGGSLAKFGYGRSLSKSALSHDLWSQLTLSPSKVTIPDDVELDFGGFGKGWLIDALGARLHELGIDHFVINGGGDILVDSPVPIKFALEHPLDSELKIGSTMIKKGALAVSSSVKRSWIQDGHMRHHIVDPRTSQPSNSPVVATYVRADSALIADTMATVLLVTPEQNDELSEQYNLKTILLTRSQLN